MTENKKPTFGEWFDAHPEYQTKLERYGLQSIGMDTIGTIWSRYYRTVVLAPAAKPKPVALTKNEEPKKAPQKKTFKQRTG